MPFILTETSFSFEDINVAHLAGADAFILKPFDLSLLKTKLKQVLNGRPAQARDAGGPDLEPQRRLPLLGKM